MGETEKVRQGIPPCASSLCATVATSSIGNDPSRFHALAHTFSYYELITKFVNKRKFYCMGKNNFVPINEWRKTKCSYKKNKEEP